VPIAVETFNDLCNILCMTNRIGEPRAVTVRLRPEMHERLAADAQRHEHSIGAELRALIRQAYAREGVVDRTDRGGGVTRG
jgi:hypothetical protein